MEEVIVNIWIRLGLDPTEDLSLIRKAYASKLKIHHPEDDPEGYQRLREAFDSAMRLAKSKFLSSFEDDEDFEERGNGQEDSTRNGEESAHPNRQSPFPPSREREAQSTSHPMRIAPVLPLPSVRKQTEAFLEKIQHLYADFPSRLSTSLWAQVLTDEVLWEIEHLHSLTKQMIVFLNDHYFLSEEVWTMLDTAFDLRAFLQADSGFYASAYPKVWEYVVRHSPASRLGYAALITRNDIDRETYLHDRESFAAAMRVHNLDLASQALEKILPVQERNPYLLHLLLQFYRENVEWERGLRLCSEALQDYPDNKEFPLLAVRFLIDLERPGEALNLLEQSFDIARTDRLDVLSLTGRARLCLEQPEAARQTYNRMLTLLPGDADAITGLARTDALLLTSPPHSSRRRLHSQFRKEWGRQPLSATIRKMGKFLLKKKLLIALFVLAHVWLATSFQQEVGMSIPHYVRRAGSPPAIPFVQTAGELRAVPSEEVVRIRLTDGAYTGIIQLKDKTTDGHIRFSFMEQKKLAQPLTSGSYKGYLIRATLGEAPLFLLSDYPQARAIYEGKQPLEVTGVVQYAFMPAWREFRTYWSRKYPLLNELPEDTLLLNIKEEATGDSGLWAMLKETRIYAVILVFFYLLLIRQIKINWRFFRYR